MSDLESSEIKLSRNKSILLAIFIDSRAGSIPVTIAPSRENDSVAIPPPQPISQSLSPFKVKELDWEIELYKNEDKNICQEYTTLL